MDEVKHALYLVFLGIKDCLSGIFSLRYFLFPKNSDRRLQGFPSRENSSRLSDMILQCTVFFALFWISIIAFDRYILNDGFILFAEYMKVNITSNILWFQTFLYCFFCMFWIFPLILLSKVLNYMWYQDIADIICKKSGIPKVTSMPLSGTVADQIKSTIVQILYCCQGFMIYFVPVLLPYMKDLWYLFHLALLSSLYAFEYKWMHQGWPLSRRILTIERKWPYFLGFGLPIAIPTMLITSFIQGMIFFSTVFPIYVISSTVTFDSQSPTYNRPCHSFKLVDYIADVVMSFCLKLGIRRKL